MSRARRLMCAAGSLAACALVLGVALAGPAPAETNVLRTVGAQIGDRSLMGATRDHPVRIDPHQRATISMTLENRGNTPVHVRYLRLSGAVVGIHFVSYQASVTVDVPPGTTKVVSAPGDFFDVDGVATGYVNARIQAVDEQRSTLATQHFVADVRGKVASSEGLFLLEALVFALVSLVDVGVAVARRRLPRNRFVSGILFAFAAASTIVAIVVGAAVARVALFEPAAWVPALLVATAGAFVLGYVSPGRLVRTAHERTDDAVIDLVAAEAVARATGESERTTGGQASHQSGDHTGSVNLAAQHDSGGFTPAPHHSGEFAPHEQTSGSHEPLQ